MDSSAGQQTARARVRLVVSGRVQGVGFRDATRQLAERHHLGGWVRNRGDGRVEAVFEGPAAEVARVVAWCEDGPPGAHVDHVDLMREEPTGESSFRIRATEYGTR
ncbi:MAG: acylphosphatase [Chloroflexota bacterium]|nr:acylphosphatase [Chloroflexota bacterium]